MGNPHPTRMKPVKIGRKHTQGISAKNKTKRQNGMKIYAEILKAKRKKRYKEMYDYWHPPNGYN